MSYLTEDDVAEILERLPPEQFKLYHILRRVMKYETGISGEPPHKINDRFFIERLPGQKKQGRKERRIQRRDWERWLKDLEKEGLIKIYPNYVFKLLLAASDGPEKSENWGGGKSGQNKWCRSSGEAVKKRCRSGESYTQDNRMILKGKEIDKEKGGAEAVKKRCRSGEEVCTTSGSTLDTNIANHNSLPVDTLVDSQKKRIDVQAQEILDYLNLKTGKKLRSEGQLNFIRARLKEGNPIEVCKPVIDLKVEDWLLDDKMRDYLTADTLFNRTKFYKYLSQLEGINPEAIAAAEESGTQRMTRGAEERKAADEAAFQKAQEEYHARLREQRDKQLSG